MSEDRINRLNDSIDRMVSLIGKLDKALTNLRESMMNLNPEEQSQRLINAYNSIIETLGYIADNNQLPTFYSDNKIKYEEYVR